MHIYFRLFFLPSLAVDFAEPRHVGRIRMKKGARAPPLTASVCLEMEVKAVLRVFISPDFEGSLPCHSLQLGKVL